MLSRQLWLILRERSDATAAQTGSRQAEGVTQEGSSTGCWTSRGKGVGRGVGKSAPHEPET